MDKMIDPFEPVSLGGIRLASRVVRSATHEGLADERGFPTEALAKLYLKLARGGVGAIVTGYAGVSKEGKSPFYRMLMMDDDASIPAYRKLTEALRPEGVPLILQIAHCGRQTRSAVTGFRPVAPSAIRDRYFREEVPRELTSGEIEATIEAFVAAIVRGRDSGFDAVQLHAAHGYLLSTFLSPYSNKRGDEWGGPLKNRARIVTEILKRARARTGDFPIWVKLNGYDGRRGGMTVAEAAEIAALLEAAGCSALEISCGVNEDNFFTTRFETHPADAVLRYDFTFDGIPQSLRPLLKPALKLRIRKIEPTRLFNLPAAREIKKAVSIPVMAVGGVRSLGDVHEALDAGGVDLVSMCKPLILEPGLVAKFKGGSLERAKCIDCCYCMMGLARESVRCYFGRLPKLA
jgi:2,4-dienoyl-CoA reductase-like NADH-dependent reductase (Old Yellow Enzyme family)